MTLSRINLLLRPLALGLFTLGIAGGMTGTLTGCASQRVSYDKATSATYAGNDQFEINSIGNSNTQSDTLKNYFYRKAYEVCASKNKGFKIVKKDSSVTNPSIYTDSYCLTRHCYPSYYYKTLPLESGIIECVGKVDPQFKTQADEATVQSKETQTQISPDQDIKANALSLELLGRSWLYSLNYDRLVSSRLALGIGISYWNVGPRWNIPAYSDLTIPIYANYYFPVEENRFFVTAGIEMISTTPNVDNDSTFLNSGGAIVLGGGYEFRSNSGLLFRISPYIIIGRSTALTLGASIGGLF